MFSISFIPFQLALSALVAAVAAEPSLAGYSPYGLALGYGYVRDGAPAYHPGGGVSYTARGPQGLSGLYGRYKREAEPSLPLLGYGYGLPAYGYGLVRDGAVAAHPYGGYSSTYRSTQGLTGLRRYRREAEPSVSYGYGYLPAASSYQQVDRYLPYGGISSYAVNDRVYGASIYDRRRSPLLSIHKREAEPSYGPSSYQSVSRYTPYGSSSYSVADNVYSAAVAERNVQPYAAYGYNYAAAGPIGYGYRGHY